VAPRQHARGRAGHGLVGLRLPDRGHRQPHDHRRREHVEPRAHRATRPLPLLPGAGGPPRRPAPGRLRARLDRRRPRRHQQVRPHGAHRQLRAPGPLRGGRLRRLRRPRRRPAQHDDEGLLDLAPRGARRPRRGHLPEQRPVRGGLPEPPRARAHRAGPAGLPGVPGLGRGPRQPPLRRARELVLPRPLPAAAQAAPGLGGGARGERGGGGLPRGLPRARAGAEAGAAEAQRRRPPAGQLPGLLPRLQRGRQRADLHALPQARHAGAGVLPAPEEVPPGGGQHPGHAAVPPEAQR